MKLEIEITEEMVRATMQELAAALVKRIVAEQMQGWKVEGRIRAIFEENFSAKVKGVIEDELQARNPEKLREKIAGVVDASLSRRAAAKIAAVEKLAAPKQMALEGEKS